MKLVLLSGGQSPDNKVLHRAAVAMCRKKKTLRMTYIPFCAENSSIFYKRMVRRYKAYGVSEFQCMPVDEHFSDVELKKALSSDMIYLAGGNTFYFLDHLKKTGLVPHLQRFAQRGGVLVGLSAGALIVTPSIHLAGIPEFDADENEVALKELSALNLTLFEFSPHFAPSPARIRRLTAYSTKTPYPIYACPDGGGVVVEGKKFTVYGKAMIFHQGQKFKVMP